jgi:glycosyltransferase involved in cell wall biosynthesis
MVELIRCAMHPEHQRLTISVCLASFNGAKFIREQVESVLAQLGPDDELVVSDDGSTDETIRLLEGFDGRLRLVDTVRAGGVVKNFERALMSCRGDLIVLCDQDDVWLDGRAHFIRERLRQVTLLVMNGEVVGPDLTPLGKDIYTMVGVPAGFIRTFISTRYVGACMAFRRELLDVVLPFPSNIRWHDWFIALVATLLFDIECSDRRTILFRRHGSNASDTGLPSKNGLFDKIKMRYWMLRAVLVAVYRYIFSARGRVR